MKKIITILIMFSLFSCASMTLTKQQRFDVIFQSCEVISSPSPSSIIKLGITVLEIAVMNYYGNEAD